MEYRFPIPSNATPVCDILNKTVGTNRRVLSLIKCFIYNTSPLRFSVQQCSKGLSFFSFQPSPSLPGGPWGEGFQFRVNSLKVAEHSYGSL